MPEGMEPVAVGARGLRRAGPDATPGRRIDPDAAVARHWDDGTADLPVRDRERACRNSMATAVGTLIVLDIPLLGVWRTMSLPTLCTWVSIMTVRCSRSSFSTVRPSTSPMRSPHVPKAMAARYGDGAACQMAATSARVGTSSAAPWAAHPDEHAEAHCGVTEGMRLAPNAARRQPPKYAMVLATVFGAYVLAIFTRTRCTITRSMPDNSAGHR